MTPPRRARQPRGRIPGSRALLGGAVALLAMGALAVPVAGAARRDAGSDGPTRPVTDPVEVPAADVPAAGATGVGTTALDQDVTVQTVVPASDDEGGEVGPLPSAPLLQVTVGVGQSLGVAVGPRCLGLEVGNQVLGCDPQQQPGPLTVDLDSRLLPGV